MTNVKISYISQDLRPDPSRYMRLLIAVNFTVFYVICRKKNVHIIDV